MGKYKIMVIKGFDQNFRRRVYLITQEEKDRMSFFDTFVLRESIDGQKIYRSAIDDKHYMII